MDLSTVLDPVYIAVLLLSIAFMVGLHALIYRFSSNPNSTNEAGRAPQNEAAPRERQLEEAGDDEEEGESDEEEPQLAHQGQAQAPKMLGKKKRAKMERDAARKEFNKYQLEKNRERIMDQKRELKEMRKQEKVADKEQATEDEAWEKYLEDKRKKEEDEYQSWKHTISVEESGSGETEKENLEARVEDIISTVKQERSVILESLSARFRTTTAKMVDLLTTLVKEKRLDGVFDEHGKFIYVSKEDRLKIAKILQRRGRVGIADLAREVNSVISIDPLPVELPEDLQSSSSGANALESSSPS